MITITYLKFHNEMKIFLDFTQNSSFTFSFGALLKSQTSYRKKPQQFKEDQKVIVPFIVRL